MKTKEQLNLEISDLVSEIVELEDEAMDLYADDFEDEYRKALNEAGDVIIQGKKFRPDIILEVLDMPSYRFGLRKFADPIINRKRADIHKELAIKEKEFKKLDEELANLDSK